jgi:hypothetical protein
LSPLPDRTYFPESITTISYRQGAQSTGLIPLGTTDTSSQPSPRPNGRLRVTTLRFGAVRVSLSGCLIRQRKAASVSLTGPHDTLVPCLRGANERTWSALFSVRFLPTNRALLYDIRCIVLYCRQLGRDRQKKLGQSPPLLAASFISSRPYTGKNDATGIHPDLPFMRPSVRGDNANRCLRVLL